VWHEFQCTFLRDAVLFHKLLSEEGWDLCAALRRAAHYPVQGRKHARVRQVLAQLLEQPWPASPDDVRDRLECLIEGGLELRFSWGLRRDETVDDTHCAHAGDPPRREGESYRFSPRCRATDPPKCAIERFWAEREPALGAIADRRATLPPDLQGVADVAARVLEGTTSARGQNCYVHLSDCVIAAEAPPEDQVVTTNVGHFRPICQLLGRELHERDDDHP